MVPQPAIESPPLRAQGHVPEASALPAFQPWHSSPLSVLNLLLADLEHFLTRLIQDGNIVNYHVDLKVV